MIKSARIENLLAIADCYKNTFSKSFPTKLGRNYIVKMLEWYLSGEDKFLFFIEKDSKCIGYCGGIIGTSSASGMVQYAFWTGAVLVLFRPWLLFHPGLRNRWRFLTRNIKSKIWGRKSVPNKKGKQNGQREESVGLVMIGVDPDFQGEGIGLQLLKEFDRHVTSFGLEKAHLSVEKTNAQAIKVYQKNGWRIVQTNRKTYSLKKYYS